MSGNPTRRSAACSTIPGHRLTPSTSAKAAAALPRWSSPAAALPTFPAMLRHSWSAALGRSRRPAIQECEYRRRRRQYNRRFRSDGFHRTGTAGLCPLHRRRGGVVDFPGRPAPPATTESPAARSKGPARAMFGANALIVGINGLSTTVSGALIDEGSSGGTGGSLVKVGSGTLILSGANTYTGLTAVSQARCSSATAAPAVRSSEMSSIERSSRSTAPIPTPSAGASPETVHSSRCGRGPPFHRRQRVSRRHDRQCAEVQLSNGGTGAGSSSTSAAGRRDQPAVIHSH